MSVTTVRDSEIKRTLAATDWPCLSTEIADEHGISQQAAHRRLQQLVEDGEVERRKINQTVLWRLTQ